MQRAPLSQSRVVEAAVLLADAEGLDAVTMRRLGTALDVGAMAVYRHVAGRDALLDLVVEAVVDELHDDEDVLEAPVDGDWEDYLRRLARGLRRTALSHPRLFPLVATRPTQAPWIRPPLRSLRWVDAFLGAMTSQGFDREAAVLAYRAFTGTLLGQLLLEVAAQGVAIGPHDTGAHGGTPAEPDTSHLQDFPHLCGASELLADSDAESEFSLAVDALVERLGALRHG